jgi:uncharacterized protein
MTTLEKAIESRSREAVARLLAAGADPNAPGADRPHWRPLHAAIEELEHGGPIDAVILLIRHGAQVDAWDGRHEATPLLMASFRGQREAVRLLLACGADPNVVGAEGDSPLRWWVELGDWEMAALLLACGATRTINEPGGLTGMTALGIAASRLDWPMIALLLEYGADPEALDADRRRAGERVPEANVPPEVLNVLVALLGSRPST